VFAVEGQEFGEKFGGGFDVNGTFVVCTVVE
jgi:hypothetical protein